MSGDAFAGQGGNLWIIMLALALADVGPFPPFTEARNNWKERSDGSRELLLGANSCGHYYRHAETKFTINFYKAHYQLHLVISSTEMYFLKIV